jgi:hypothetical protein
MGPVRLSPVTIADTEFLSEPLSVGGETIIGIAMPDDWTAANITVQASFDGETYNELYEADGDAVVIRVRPGGTTALDPTVFAALNFVKFRSGTPGVIVAQVGDKEMSVLLREPLCRVRRYSSQMAIGGPGGGGGAVPTFHILGF